MPGTFIESGKPKKTFWIILVAIGILVLSIVGGVIGTKANKDESCACRKKTDSGWMGFSITYFILTVVAVIVFAVLFFKGKTKGAASAAFLGVD